MTSFLGPRVVGVGTAATAVVCPCHILAGAVVGATAALTGAVPTLSPALQDGIHAAYLPIAVLLSARLLTARGRTTVAGHHSHSATGAGPAQ